MGRTTTLVIAALLLAGAAFAGAATGENAIETSVETDVATAHTATDGLDGNGSANLTPENASQADGSLQLNASVGGADVGVESEPGEGRFNVSLPSNGSEPASTVAELVDADPDLPEVVDLPSEAPVENAGQLQTRSASAPTSGDDGQAAEDPAWTLVPATGIAAAAAVSQATPVGRWLRRVVTTAPLAPLYSRIGRQDVLDHEARAAIYELLEEEAGLSLASICEQLDLARSTARHHVRKLEDAGMIEHVSVGRARVHHLVGERARALRDHLLSNGTRAQVHEAVADEARTITEVAERIDANPGSVHFHLEKLAEAGLVATVDDEDRRYRVCEGEDVVFEPA